LIGTVRVGRNPAVGLATRRSVESLIYVVRGQKVMLDSDLAALYQVTTGNLNLAVRRNQRRFPADFMFALSADETNALFLQNARAKVVEEGDVHRPSPLPSWVWPCWLRFCTANAPCR
jgi:hypothetical protein